MRRTSGTSVCGKLKYRAGVLSYFLTLYMCIYSLLCYLFISDSMIHKDIYWMGRRVFITANQYDAEVEDMGDGQSWASMKRHAHSVYRNADLQPEPVLIIPLLQVSGQIKIWSDDIFSSGVSGGERGKRSSQKQTGVQLDICRQNSPSRPVALHHQNKHWISKAMSAGGFLRREFRTYRLRSGRVGKFGTLVEIVSNVSLHCPFSLSIALSLYAGGYAIKTDSRELGENSSYVHSVGLNRPDRRMFCGFDGSCMSRTIYFWMGKIYTVTNFVHFSRKQGTQMRNSVRAYINAWPFQVLLNRSLAGYSQACIHQSVIFGVVLIATISQQSNAQKLPPPRVTRNGGHRRKAMGRKRDWR